MMLMRGQVFLYLIAFCLITGSLRSQSWEFSKEKDGIRIYTRKDQGQKIKSYRAEAEINAPSEKIFSMLEDVNHTEWWDKNISQVKVLRYEKFKHARYYLIYDLPWPVTDRDLCVDVKTSFDPLTGVGSIAATPLPGCMPAGDDMVRIVEYRQTWEVKPLGKEKTKVVLEGFVNPAGNVPEWLSNMLIVDSPLKIMRDVKILMEKR